MKKLIFDPKTYIIFSIGVNAFMATAKIITGVFTFSIFILINACYNAGMGLAKAYILRSLKQDASIRNEYEVFRTTGIILLLSSIVYVVYSACMFSVGKSDKYPRIIAIGIVVVVMIEIIVNLVGLISTKRSRHLILHANKCLSLASSLINLVLVQTALLSIPQWSHRVLFNNLAGVFFGSCAAGLGLYMLIFGKIQKERAKSGKKVKYAFKVFNN